MKEILRNNKFFLFPFTGFLVLGACLFIVFRKDELHLILNLYHNSTFDLLFYYFTWLGEFITPIVLTFILLFVRYRYTIYMFLSNLLASAITQTLKHTFFSEIDRPKKIFLGSDRLQFVEGVQNWMYHSFPSGHTTAAFATFFTLALIVKEPISKLIFFLVALAVGYSRVYLSQHFFTDIYAGSIIGSGSALLIYYYVSRSKRPWLENAVFRNRK